MTTERSRRRATYVSVIVLAAFVSLTSCGGGSSEDADGAAPKPTATSSFTPPPNVESETCRSDAAAWFEIPATLDPSSEMAYDEFKRKFDAMTAQVDTAMATCTAAVEDPVREAMYDFALANAQWRTCQTSACEGKIAAALVKGFDKITTAKAALDKRK